MLKQFINFSFLTWKWFIAAFLWMSAFGATGTAANVRSLPYASDQLPARYSVGPLPRWFQPLQTDVKSDFHVGSDRYLSRQMAVRVDDKGLTHEVHHAVLELSSSDHPWLKNAHAQLDAIQFDEIDQSIVLHTLKIYRNGRVEEHTTSVKPRFSKLDRLASTPDDLTLRNAELRLPQLKRGDRVEWAYSIVTNKLSLPYRYGNMVIWQEPDSAGRTYPVVQERQFFLWSTERPHRPVEIVRDDAENSLHRLWLREDKDIPGWKQVAWTAVRIESQPFDPNSKMHIPTDVLPYDVVGITEFAPGSDVADDLIKPYLTAPPPKSKAYTSLMALLSSESEPAERAAAALRWVQMNIRYELDVLPIPMSADDVLAARKGDCKDVSMLLWHLMRSLGIESEVAFLDVNMGRWPSRFGALARFNHVVALVWIDGKPFVLDGTLAVQPSSLYRMGNYYPNRDLRIAHGSRAGYIRIPPNKDIESRTRYINKRTVVEADLERLTVTSELRYGGAMADYYRGIFSRSDEAERRNLFMSLTRDMETSDVWLEPLVVVDDVVNNQLSLRAKTRYKHKFRKSSDGRYLYRIALHSGFDLLTKPSAATKRVNPLLLPFDQEQRSVSIHTLSLPKGWSVDGGKRLESLSHPTVGVKHVHIVNEGPEDVEVRDEVVIDLRRDRVVSSEFSSYGDVYQKALRLLDTNIRFGP